MLTILLSSCLVWQRCAAPSMISQCMPCCQCLCDTWYCQAYACFGMPTASPRKLPEVDNQITAGACYFDYLSLYQCACRRQNISSDEQERTGTFNGLVISTSGPLGLKDKGGGHTVCSITDTLTFLPWDMPSFHAFCSVHLPQPLHNILLTCGLSWQTSSYDLPMPTMSPVTD